MKDNRLQLFTKKSEITIYRPIFRIFHIISFSLLLTVCIQAQNSIQPTHQDTLKGSITPERAWWDVLHYDITIKTDLRNKTISGKNIISFKVMDNEHPGNMQIDLQEPLNIDSIYYKKVNLPFRRDGSAFFVTMPEVLDSVNEITIHYSGKPKESKNPPYEGGLIWAKDSLNRPWISVACQLVGGSVWYPCKDHYSEEPDHGATLSLIVPDSLIAVGNGRLKETIRKEGQTRYTWEVVNPINNYGLTFYIGKYIELKRTFNGEKGPLDMSFWVLDYNQSRAIDYLIPEVNTTMKIFEKWFGPFPFYEDGYKIVDASYIGMEHQSAIAYGNHYKKGRHNFKNLSVLDYKTDRLIVHETAHEWFGNNITMSDMADRWFQEGFAAYGEELAMEELLGREMGREFFIKRRGDYIKNEQPVISSYGMFKDAGPDMYFKGWAIVHMLRELVDNDELFRKMLREMNREFYHKTSTSRHVEKFISDFTDLNLDPFFDQYLRIASLPVIEYSIVQDRLYFRLDSDVLDFEMPVKIINGLNSFWLLTTSEWQEIALPEEYEADILNVDPNFLIKVKQVNYDE